MNTTKTSMKKTSKNICCHWSQPMEVFNKNNGFNAQHTPQRCPCRSRGVSGGFTHGMAEIFQLMPQQLQVTLEAPRPLTWVCGKKNEVKDQRTFFFEELKCTFFVFWLLQRDVPWKWKSKFISDNKNNASYD